MAKNSSALGPKAKPVKAKAAVDKPAGKPAGKAVAPPVPKKSSSQESVSKKPVPKAAQELKAPKLQVKTKAEKIKVPSKELKTWLKGRKVWNHPDWLDLLSALRTAGHSLVDTAEGQVAIGAYLEANRE